MIAKLEFDLDKPGEAETFRRYCAADKLAALLWDMLHGNSFATRQPLSEDARETICNWMDEDGINLEEIYT